jgi:hypothetical protein
MLDNEKLELAGPIGVIAAVICAKVGAHALANWPTSAFLWYLNLEVFQSFRYSLDGIGVGQWLSADGLEQSTWIAAPLSALVCLGLVLKIRLPLAIASNGSFIYSILLLYGSYTATHSATLPHFELGDLWGPSTILAAAIVVASLMSSIVSHRSYWREIFS